MKGKGKGNEKDDEDEMGCSGSKFTYDSWACKSYDELRKWRA